MKIHAIKKIINAISFIALSFFLTAVVLAQSNTGTITGVVTDPNGAVVPNATAVPPLVTLDPSAHTCSVGAVLVPVQSHESVYEPVSPWP